MDPMGSASTHSQKLHLHANNPNNALVCFGQSLNIVLLHRIALLILLITDYKENPSKLQYICIQFDATLDQWVQSIYLVVQPTHLIHIFVKLDHETPNSRGLFFATTYLYQVIGALNNHVI